jgi:multidrug resistance protein
VILVTLQATLSPAASTSCAVASIPIADDFGISNPYLVGFPVALYVLGLGLGPVCLAPLSERFGRRPIYIIGFGLFAVLNVCCALAPTFAALIILRLLAGIIGSAAGALGGATIGDMFRQDKRALPQAVFGLGPTGGIILGALLGAFTVARTGGWRWVMWIIAIAAGTVTVLCAVLLRETYRLSVLPITTENQICTNAFRPLYMLVQSPTCAFISFYLAM